MDTQSDFSSLGLADHCLAALRAEGYERPTPIQTLAIPPVLAGRDLLGCAQTGTGKTAAFALPIIQRLAATQRDARHGLGTVRALVVAPTRELAAQIDDSFGAYGRDACLKRACVFGGVGKMPQIKALSRGVDVLVATPGRLLDLHAEGELTLAHVEIVVLDEADRMLDMGFIHDVRRIVALLPKKRQTLLFSATMPAEIETLARSLLADPVRVAVSPEKPAVELIEQRLMFVDKGNKRNLLVSLVQGQDVQRAIVFTRTKHGANRLAEALEHAGIGAAAIHANKSQNHRIRTMDGFREGRLRILVATDLAARGIDVDGITHVFNFDLPTEPETYVHRIGRTARAGASGTAISFCDAEERKLLKQIERLLGRAVPVVADHPYAGVAAAGGAIDDDRPDRRPRTTQSRGSRPTHSQRPGGGHRSHSPGQGGAPTGSRGGRPGRPPAGRGGTGRRASA